MADYETSAPGVHLEEIATTAGPIAGVGTSTAALIGLVAAPPADNALGKPVPVTNWTSYRDSFGGLPSDQDEHRDQVRIPYAVRGFFDNGGTLAYVVPVRDLTAATLSAALDQLSRLAEVSLVCAPGLVDPEGQKELIASCEDLKDRFAVLDGAPDPTPLRPDGPLQTQRGNLLSKSGFAGLYWPWLVVDDGVDAAGQPRTTTAPPCGHIAGVMARSDAERGVHKAPANEPVRGALDLGYALNNAEHGALNHAGINAVRRFPAGPPLVWGARTLTDGTAWRYVNVRRLVCYIEESVLQGVRWAVFEPNNTGLWKGLERSITEFLVRVWQTGALFGRKAEEAFYVKIDEELNPPAVRDLGQVIVEIGVAPTRPAEYVIVRLGLWSGGASVSEGQ